MPIERPADRQPKLLRTALIVHIIVNGLFAMMMMSLAGALAGLIAFAIGTAALFVSYAVGYALAKKVVRTRRPGWVFLVFPLFANSLFLALAALVALNRLT